MARGRTAEDQRRYRARVAAGEQTVQPRALPPVVVMTPDERAQLSALWMETYRSTVAGWLIRQRSPHTRRAYQRGWNRWVQWCNERGVVAHDPPHGTGGVFLAEMRAGGYSDATLRQWQTAIRECMAELSAVALRAGGDPFARVAPFGGGDQSSRAPIGDGEVAAMVAAARELGGHHLTVVLILAVMGVRASEAAQVCARTVRRSQWGWVAEIVRKGNRRAIVPVPESVRAAMLEAGCWPMDGRSGNGYERVRYLVDKVAVRAGVEVTCHQFRHWHVTAALKAGVPLERVQDSVGHADPKTTQRYNRARVIVEGHSAFTIEKLPAIGAGTRVDSPVGQEDGSDG